MGFSVTIEPCDAVRLDTLDVDALVLPLYSVVAQPQGVAGHVDWRLCGRLGRLLRDCKFRGMANEVMLLSYRRRLMPQRVFLFGLGKPSKKRSRERCHRDVERMIEILDKAGARSVALGPPEPGPHVVVGGWLSAPTWRKSSFDRLTVLDSGGVLAGELASLKSAATDGGLVITKGRSASKAATSNAASSEATGEVVQEVLPSDATSDPGVDVAPRDRNLAPPDADPSKKSDA